MACKPRPPEFDVCSRSVPSRVLENLSAPEMSARLAYDNRDIPRSASSQPSHGLRNASAAKWDRERFIFRSSPATECLGRSARISEEADELIRDRRLCSIVSRTTVTILFFRRRSH